MFNIFFWSLSNMYIRYSFESFGTLNLVPSGLIIWLRHLVIELILGARLSYILILSYKFQTFKWPLYIMSLIFCYFRTKYKPGDFLCGPGVTASPTPKVEGEGGRSAPPPPAGLCLHGRTGSLLRRRGGRPHPRCRPRLTGTFYLRFNLCELPLLSKARNFLKCGVSWKY